MLGRVGLNALLCETFTPDTTSPSLFEFTEINLAQKTTKLTFTETVSITTFSAASITLQSLFETPLSKYGLTEGTAGLSDNTLVTIILSAMDVKAIKTVVNLCTRRGTCYITATSALIEDMNGNAVNEVVDGFPEKIVAKYAKDNVRPNLTSCL